MFKYKFKFLIFYFFQLKDNSRLFLHFPLHLNPNLSKPLIISGLSVAIQISSSSFFKFYVWVGSNDWMNRPPRFIWLPHNVKRSIYLTDIPIEQQDDEAPIISFD